MPIYVYECESCHKQAEYMQSVNDPRKTVCEHCGGKLERVISATAFHLKGGGWYKDLYSSSKDPGASSSGSSSSSSSSSSTSTSTSTSTATPASTPSTPASSTPASSSGSGGGSGGGSDKK